MSYFGRGDGLDSPPWVIEVKEDQGSDIEVLSCLDELTPYRPQTVAGRIMTTDVSSRLDVLSLPGCLYSPTTKKKL